MKTFNELLEDIYASQYKIKKVQSQNPTTGDWEWHDRKVRTKRIDFKNSKMGGKPSQEDEDMKEESTPYWKKPSFNKRMSQMAKQERREREQKEAEKKTVKEENMTIDEQINEVLSKDATAGDWIHDFVHSDNPKFDGKSKEKRKQMALAAYYAKQQNEEVEPIEELETKTLKSYINKNIKSGRADDGGKGDTGLYTATNKVARKLATSTLDKKVNKLGNISALAHKNPYEYDASRSELKNRGIHHFAGRRTRTEEVELEEGMYSSDVERAFPNGKASGVKTYAPVAPVPDKKYIKGTPENKALRASRKPINGHPTNVKEGTMKSFKEMMQSLDESNYDSAEEANRVASKLKSKYKDGNYHVAQQNGRHKVQHAYFSNTKVKDQIKKLAEEVEQIDELNHREFASQGLMHPDMSKHMTVGKETDYYEPKTGDKISGKVMHKSDTEVHMKQTADSYNDKKVGSIHKFKVSSKMNEAKKDDVPFDGPYTKSPGNVKDKSGAVHTPMSRARDLARQAMKKQMKEDIDVILEATDSHEYADGEMSIHELKQIKAHSEWILEMLKPDTDMPEWVQAKITLAADYLSTACDYLHVEMNEELKGGQKKLDKNHNGKLDSADFKMLRGEECPECHKAPCECDSMKEDTYPGLEKMKKMGLPTAARSSHPRGVNIDTVEGWDHPHDAVKKKEVKEESDVQTRSLSFKDFIGQLNEYTPGPGGVTRVQGRSYGAQYRDPEGEDDADEKKKQVAKPEPAVKRGRGRPAGSKSGANQKVTSGTKRTGVDYTGYKLHLPNTNR